MSWILVQRRASERNVLHRDCSLHNAMIADGPDGSVGLLIDWEFAVFITSDDRYSIGGTVNTSPLNS